MLSLFAATIIILFLGCSAAHKATKTTGTYIGKGAQVTGGLYEGVAEGIKGEETEQENPFGR